jgi:hypothetical protein
VNASDKLVAAQLITQYASYIIIIIIIIIYLFIFLLTAIEFSLGGSSPHPSTDKTDKNIYT